MSHPFKQFGLLSGLGLLLVLCPNIGAQQASFSGKITDSLGHPAFGVQIHLASSPQAILATSDMNGLWRVGGLTGISSRREARSAERHNSVVLGNGSLRIQISGARIDGKLSPLSYSYGNPALNVSNDQPNPASRRALSGPDTLLFSLDGEIKTRKSLESSPQGDLGTTIVRLNGSITDPRDQHTYGTIWIGTQRWLSSNLQYAADSSWTYHPSTDSAARHGRLYTWAAAMGLNDSCNRSSCLDQILTPHRGSCPRGWHVPSQQEWRTLVESRGEWTLKAPNVPVTYDSGPKQTCFLDDIYTLHCTITGPSERISTTGTDSWGFHGYHSGYSTPAHEFLAAQDTSFWWTTDHLNTDYEDYLKLFTVDPAFARAWRFTRNTPFSTHLPVAKSFGLSLRCLQD